MTQEETVNQIAKTLIRSHQWMSVTVNPNVGDSRGPCIELDDPSGTYTVWVEKDA